MKSIRNRLVKNFVLITIISVFILEAILINFVKQYYYNNVESILTNQIKISADFYSRYFSNTSLEDNLLDNVDVFWKQTLAQVQIIDPSGKVLMDSIGVIPKEEIQDVDFKKALHGQKGTWRGKVAYDRSNVIAVAYPLKSDDQIVGVIRFITTLREVNKEIANISLLFFIIGIIVISIVIVFSIFLANTIIEPLKEVTQVAEKMAAGNFKVRSYKRFNDEIGKLSDTLNYMAEEILKKDQLKNEFICSVSHELRTPLTAIKGWAVTLNKVEPKDKELVGEGLKIIEKESDRLTLMVEELLDFSKFVSGRISLNKEKVDIKNLIQYIEKHMRPRALRENIKLIVQYEQILPIIDIDENRIKQVLINILDNAFKFTSPEGTVFFITKQEQNYISMCIIDNGCGISSEDLPRVKEKFYKGKSSKSQNGIGLSICDEIIKMHHGLLEINSELNKGTTVYIKLPL